MLYDGALWERARPSSAWRSWSGRGAPPRHATPRPGAPLCRRVLRNLCRPRRCAANMPRRILCCGISLRRSNTSCGSHLIPYFFSSSFIYFSSKTRTVLISLFAVTRGKSYAACVEAQSIFLFFVGPGPLGRENNFEYKRVGRCVRTYLLTDLYLLGRVSDDPTIF